MIIGVIALLLSQRSVGGNSMISGRTEDSEIVIRTASRFCGAIWSLTWRGKEFIDSADHGRELQSASNLDLSTPIAGETFNPTEAGSRDDGDKNLTSGILERLKAKANHLETTTRMAFWLQPGEDSGGNLAKNTTILSNHRLIKDVTIGLKGHPHVIRYNVEFDLPADEHHSQAVFEALTGYMPPEFSKFECFDPATKSLVPISDGPGEQGNPVVLSTPDGAYAMGIYSTESQTKGYGRFRFVPEKVVKWNCVFRVTNPKPGGRYAYHMFVLVGTENQVRDDMAWLAR